MKRIPFLFLVILLAGCAVGNKYDYRSSSIDLPIKATEHNVLVFSIEDLRSYVLDGKKEPSFVGLQRGGFGNPFNVTTASGKSLIEDMSVAITTALTDSGYQVFIVKGARENDFLVHTATEKGATRILTLKINEWKSDIFASITLHCDIGLMIFDSDGKLIAESSMKFVEEIGGALLSGSKNSEIVANEFAKRIGYLFNKNEIRSVL